MAEMDWSDTRLWTYSEAEEGSSYDLDRYYTRSTDEKGHSNTFRINVNTLLGAQIRGKVADPNFPGYKTAPDFIRDAIYHRLKYLANKRELIDSQEAMEQERIAQEHARAQEQREMSRRTVEGLTKSMRSALDDRDHDAAREFVQIARAAMDYLPLHWTEKLGREVEAIERDLER